MPVWSRARKARLLRFAMNLYPPFLGRASVCGTSLAIFARFGCVWA